MQSNHKITVTDLHKLTDAALTALQAELNEFEEIENRIHTSRFLEKKKIPKPTLPILDSDQIKSRIVDFLAARYIVVPNAGDPGQQKPVLRDVAL